MRSARKPLADVSTQNKVGDEDITVEQFLERQCDSIINDLKQHSASLVDKLKKEYADGVKGITSAVNSTAADTQKKLFLTIKVMTGAHMGQKFRLEPSTDDGEDVFKIGRSTGKAFKEKGVSLYKDKEISTSHAKFEVKNGQVFLIDTKSTNGTTLNGEDVTPDTPLRLKSGDVITMGGSELHVTITELDDGSSSDENFASV